MASLGILFLAAEIEWLAMIETIVVIPCFNEAQRLDLSTFSSFIKQHPEQRLFFVNDGSTDGTSGLLAQLQRKSQGQMLVRDLPRNVGKAEAVRQGLLEALGHGPDYVGFWDADLATPLDEIATLRNILRQQPHLQMAMGSRVALLGRFIERSPMRH